MATPILKLTSTPISKTILRRTHFGGSGLTSFKRVEQVQTQLTTDLLASKSHQHWPSHIQRTPASLRPIPDPTVLTMEFEPVYTLGRRERKALMFPEKQKLRYHGAQIFETLRGGQTTFHGPGQLTAYVIIDLIRFKLSPRCYVAMLEDAMIETCAHYGIVAFKTKDTGVWTSEKSKIGAVGVHMRRNVTSYGIALNVSTDMRWFTEIVPCGLVGKEMTSFEIEGVHGRTVPEVGGVFCERIAEKIGCEEVKRIGEKQLIDWLEEREVQHIPNKMRNYRAAIL